MEPHHLAKTGAVLGTGELGIQLVLSDTAPGTSEALLVAVCLRTGTGSASANAASYTAQLRYDTLALRYLGEVSLDDSTLATRALNPTAGLIRAAGIAPRGFTGGKLFALEFQVRRPAAVRSGAALSLRLDEMHSIPPVHSDLRARVSVLAPTMEQLP